jgi:carbamoyl-phosphate synthase/aspartate carbamoyltransferase
MPEEIVDELAQQGLSQTQHEDIDAVIRTTDVLYVTRCLHRLTVLSSVCTCLANTLIAKRRVQKERFASEEQYMQVRDAFVVDPPLLAKVCEQSQATIELTHRNTL